MFGASWVCSRCLPKVPLPARPLTLLRRQLYSSDVAATGLPSLSLVLLSRARSIAQEHETLNKKLADSYDSKIGKRAGELAATAAALREWDKAHEVIDELETLLKDPSTDAELRSLAQEDLVSTNESLSAISANLKKALIPQHPFAALPCLIEIRPGAGGDEAGLFAGELLRMYLGFCSRHGLRTVLLKKETEDGASGAGSEERLSEAILEIESPGSYEIFRPESGVHRVQRVPATESKGRTHTSAVSVMILPSFPASGTVNSALDFDDPNSDYYIDPQEVRSEKMRASGAGGQHVNKTESAIRLTHIPTGTVVSMQDSRSQQENRKRAWQLLRAKIAEIRREAREAELVNLRRDILGGVSKMGRGDKIRTYNFGQNRCTDHRSGMTLHNLPDILEGGAYLDKLMDSVRTWLVDQDIDALHLEEEAKQASQSKGGTKRMGA